MLIFAVFALIFWGIISRYQISSLQQQMANFKQAFGFLDINDSQFELLKVGSKQDSGQTNEFLGAFLIRMSRPKTHSLQVTFLDGKAGKGYSKMIPFVCSQVAITLDTGYADVSHIPVKRMIEFHRTDQEWRHGCFDKSSVPYEPFFTYSLREEKGEVHDGAILSVVFYAGRLPDFDARIINTSTVEDLEDMAQELDLKILYLRIVKSEKEKGTQLIK